MLIYNSIRTFESRDDPFVPAFKTLPVSLIALYSDTQRVYFYCQNSAACTVSDANFTSHKTKPLMLNNPIWKEVRQDRNDVGALLEIQTVACTNEMKNLGKVWWPLTHAHISKSLQVRKIRSTQKQKIFYFLGCPWH